MIVNKINNIRRLKAQWQHLEGQTDCEGTMSFEYNLGVWRLYLPQIIKRRCLPVFYEVVENGKSMIIPLCRKFDGSYVSFNNHNYTPYDILGSDERLFGAFLQSMKGAKISFCNLKTTSKLYEHLHSYDRLKVYEKGNASYKVSLSDGYEAWYEGLHKSVRQNLRTAYNRLNREDHPPYRIIIIGNDGTTQEIQIAESNNSERVYQSCNLSGYQKRQLKKKMMTVYTKRLERYHVHKGWVGKFMLNHFNPCIKNAERMSSAYRFVLEIDGQVASLLIGFVSTKGGSVYVPILSTNTDFAFYSPGVILINEAIRYFLSTNGVKEIDLGMGDESYKIKMGGEEYSMNNIVIDTSKL